MSGQRYYVEQWPIRSFTDPDKPPYTVSLASDGHYECSCMAWTRRRNDPRFCPNGECKHIRWVRENRPTQEQMAQARRERRPVVIRNSQYTAELVEDGRLKGFIDSL